MKQSSGWVNWSPRESEVAEILVKLETLILILELEGGRRFPFTWGLKKKRSAIASQSESPPPPPPPKAEAASPATPLSFSPSESDDNPTLTHTRRNVSLKRKREHYLQNIEELTKSNDLLYGEINNVKSYFDRLKDFNFKLKARKQELSRVPNQDDIMHKQPQLKFPGAAQHVPLMANQTAVPPRISYGEGVAAAGAGAGARGQATTSLGVASSSGRALGVADTSSYDVGPTGIPDLNVPLEEPVGVDCCEALDVNVVMANSNRNLSRARAAQARQNRLQIYRVKNPFANTKTRYSCR